MAVVSSAGATFLHEAIGHGVTAWALGCRPTELTSNHLSSEVDNPWVSAGGTLVNLAAGAAMLVVSSRVRGPGTARYFWWLFAALNLLPGAGYFLFSGLGAVGDWYAIIQGSPHEGAWRVALACLGALLYFVVVRTLARAAGPFVPERSVYNVVGRWPYLVAGLFSVSAGLLDPLGLKLLFLSTVPAAFGGSSGLMWADALLRKPLTTEPLTVERSRAWWLVAAVLGGTYVLVLGPGIRL